MKRHSYDRDAYPVTVSRDGAASVAEVTCANCRNAAAWRIGNGLPAVEVLHKHFRRKGWDIGRAAVCETCQAKKRRKPEMNPPGSRPLAVAPKPAAAPAATPAPSDAMRKVRRLVYQALEDYYDDTRKSYRAPHSDKSVATELGTSETVVREVREADFGPLSEPDEVRALRAEVTALREGLAATESKFALLAQRNGWAV